MKGAQPQVQTVAPDAGTQAYVQQLRNMALGYAGAPGSPGTIGSGLWGQFIRTPGFTPTAPNLPSAVTQTAANYGNAGNLGIGALTGGPNPFMNPYISQMDPYFAQQRAQAVNAANDQATAAGAFGGDRSLIGSATAGNLADQNAAQFRFQGFNDSMQRALQAANLGYGAAFLPQQYAQGQLNLLNSAMGPTGQTTTIPQQRNVGAGILGGALAGAPLGPWGIVGGGLLGSGIFG